MINFLFWTVLTSEASKVDPTHKFDDFLDHTQFFHIWPDRVLIEMNSAHNVIYNFEYHDHLLNMHRFLTIGASTVDQKRFFLWYGWILPTSETHGLETVYLRELIMKFKGVYNAVSDNFYFDQNNVRCHWK